jgi:hypothetical protein
MNGPIGETRKPRAMLSSYSPVISGNKAHFSRVMHGLPCKYNYALIYFSFYGWMQYLRGRP